MNAARTIARFAPTAGCVLLTLIGCSDAAGPGTDARTLGILQIGPPGDGEAATEGPLDEGVEWSLPPGDGVIVPPAVLEAPAVVTTGLPFDVVARTIGPNGCWSAEGLDLSQTQRVVELTPWDRHSGADACPEIFLFLAHEASVTLEEPGIWTVRVLGRRVVGGGAEAGPVTAERTVYVRAAEDDALPTDVVLAPGESAGFGAFDVAFAGVGEDSRCPVDVECVWQGNAEVELGLTLGTGPTRPFTVNTGIEPSVAEHGGYRVTLLGLEPRPLSDAPIDPADYRARLWVERVEG